MTLVDTHVHLVSPDTQTYPLTPLDSSVNWFRESPCSLEQLVEIMHTHDVHRAFLVQTMGAYSTDNSYVVDAASTDPDRLCAIAYVDATMPDAAATLEGWAARGARGVRITAATPHAGGGFDDARVANLIDHAAAMQLHVLLAMRSEGLASVGRLLGAAPERKLSIDHCGLVDLSGGHPYPGATDLFALSRYPGVTLKVSTIALVRASRVDDGDPAPFLETLVERFGVQRLMWASNYSQTNDLSYAEMIALARRATRALAETERDALFSGTALAQWPA